MRVTGLSIIILACSAITAAVRSDGSEFNIHADSESSVMSHHKLMDLFHTNLSTSAWNYTKADFATMKEAGGVLDLLNKPSDGSLMWEWDPSNGEWTYPFTNKTAQELHVRALALHMLHRHGMGPLAAAKHANAFDEFYKGASVHDFVETLENFPVVNNIFMKLSKMTLDGLRNVHSHDHAWSVRENEGDGCRNGGNPEKCMLQASFSKHAHELMEKYGFTYATAKGLHSEWDTYTDELWYNNITQAQKVEGRLKLWAYEEADFFQLYDPDLAK